jgi:hypothetical protein
MSSALIPVPMPTSDVVEAMRASLEAKLERALQRPYIASVRAEQRSRALPTQQRAPSLFDLFDEVASEHAPQRREPWIQTTRDGTWLLRLSFDYDDTWRGCEKEILDTVRNQIEDFVTYLTEEQKRLLERSPREFLELNPRPECAELLSFRTENVGGSERVLELEVEAPPTSPDCIRYIAIVPNLVPFERQLEALRVLERAEDDGPVGPLRALAGLHEDAGALMGAAPGPVAASVTRLDEHQRGCVQMAMDTPHFALIQGPPGSGKTTVITEVIRRSLERGERVLVVSPTHVAVDNVVEKLTSELDPESDGLAARSLPVRYAAKRGKLLPQAELYWMGSKQQRRAGTIQTRLVDRLAATCTDRKALRALVRESDQDGLGVLSSALVRQERVICGTPIGILSHEQVKRASPGDFDLLVVDEVSKMTLPEFLAVAVKAKRWVLVGDPMQLPPFNDAVDNGGTLRDLLSSAVEVICSLASFLEYQRPQVRPQVRLVVACRDPERALEAAQAHLRHVGLEDLPRFAVWAGQRSATGVLFCSPSEVDEAADALAPASNLDRSERPEHRGTTWVLAERGRAVRRPRLASGVRFVEPRLRASAQIFEKAFNTLHLQPWACQAQQRLSPLGMRKGLARMRPSPQLLHVADGLPAGQLAPSLERLEHELALRFAVNTLSVYDWLSGLPTEHYDVEPLTRLAEVLSPTQALRGSVQPFSGVLKLQYRMHSSISCVPRRLFYFDRALLDGRSDDRGSRVRLVQVSGGGRDECNEAEVERVSELLGALERFSGAGKSVMVITPYRKQEAALRAQVERLQGAGSLGMTEVEVCTLDRCQGREADYVLISLVRSRASAFMDSPKRWNVALTRAKEGLFIVGDVQAYLHEASQARRDRRGRGRPPRMSLLARIVESYQHQIEEGP